MDIPAFLRAFLNRVIEVDQFYSPEYRCIFLGFFHLDLELAIISVALIYNQKKTAFKFTFQWILHCFKHHCLAGNAFVLLMTIIIFVGPLFCILN